MTLYFWKKFVINLDITGLRFTDIDNSTIIFHIVDIKFKNLTILWATKHFQIKLLVGKTLLFSPFWKQIDNHISFTNIHKHIVYQNRTSILLHFPKNSESYAKILNIVFFGINVIPYLKMSPPMLFSLQFIFGRNNKIINCWHFRSVLLLLLIIGMLWHSTVC